jgi:hypothetical protein
MGLRFVGLHGRFGLLLTTGEVLRITSIAAVHQSSDGLTLLDVSLDSAGVPEGVDLAWRPKQFLGSPVPGATSATVNLAHVVMAMEFLGAMAVDQPRDQTRPTADEVVVELARVAEAAADEVAAAGEKSPSHVAGALAGGSVSEPAVEIMDLPVAPLERTRKRKKRR